MVREYRVVKKQHFLTKKSSKNSPKCQKKVDHLDQNQYNTYIDSNKQELKMTEFESKCYGMSEVQIREEYMNSITAKFSGLEMVAMGVLSDAQELMAMGRTETARKQINIAKFILSEMMDARVSA